MREEFKEENFEYVDEYVEAYQEMKRKAIKVIQKYGKELDLRQIIKDKNPDADDDELEAVIMNECYSVFFSDWNDEIHDCLIQGVRYNEERKVVEVFLHSYDGDIDEWMSSSYISGADDNVYMTILKNCPSD